ncbi:DNA-binding protein [Candidatus Woesearchaeota archaeon]|nr:DNA-binding protein [Candidatus Woesearchaeota archaeon]
MVSEKKIVILDTNVLVTGVQWKIDIFLELEKVCDFAYQLAVLQGTINELKKIQAEQRGKFRDAAKLALLLLKKKKVRVLPEEGYVDALLVNHSRKGDVILTQDKELKKKLVKPYFTLRQKKYVVKVE